MYTDSLVGLLRMYVFWDWLRFFLQLMLCQWMLNFKQTLVKPVPIFVFLALCVLCGCIALVRASPRAQL
jgi:hypothetical protein